MLSIYNVKFKYIDLPTFLSVVFHLTVTNLCQKFPHIPPFPPSPRWERDTVKWDTENEICEYCDPDLCWTNYDKILQRAYRARFQSRRSKIFPWLLLLLKSLQQYEQEAGYPPLHPVCYSHNATHTDYYIMGKNIKSAQWFTFKPKTNH